MNRVILMLLPLFLYLAACYSPTPTNLLTTPSPLPSLTLTRMPGTTWTVTYIPPSATQDLFKAKQTQNAITHATLASKATSNAVATKQVQTPIPTQTEILSTPAAIFTPTPLPPLTAHTWTPQTVLISNDSFGGDGCCDYRLFPDLVLFGDGQLFITELIELDGNIRQQVLRTQLNDTQVCSILNSLDQIGFLAYDATTYFLDENETPQEYFSSEGMGTRIITVNAWQSNSASFYGLGTYIYENEYHPLCNPCSGNAPTILPALLNTYHFLENIPNLAFNYEIYLPDKIELWVYPPYETTQFAPNWPFPAISLSNLLQQGQDASGNPLRYTVTSTEARAIYEFFRQADDPAHVAFKENNQLYEVFIRPLYPYPWDTSESLPGIPKTLTCTPEDGVLEFLVEE